MIYEVQATFYFSDQSEAEDFHDNCLDALEKAVVINPDTPEQQCSFVDTIENHHDEHPPQPCHLITHTDNCPVE